VGLHRAGFTSLLAVEWDKDAHATLAAAGLSARAECGDVRDMARYDGLEGKVDLLWASPPCFPAGAPVITDEGIRPIESLREGDLVLTHKGRYRRVACKMVKPYSGELVVFTVGYGRGTIRCTPEHPVYAKQYRGHKNHKDQFGEPEWVEAKDLHERDLVLEPRVTEAVAYAPPSFHKNHSLGGRWREPVREAYCVRYVPPGNSRPGKVAEEGAWIPVRSIGREAFSGDVHNVEVEEDNSYTVNAVAVHNCQAWSTAGKRLGAFDERNGWPWTLDVVDKIQPKWVLGENVTGLINHQSECQVVTGKVRTGEALDLFQDDVDESQVGLPPPEDCPGCYWERVVLPEFRKRYAFVSWKVMNCANYGVAQRRERVILLAGPEEIPWPEPTHSVEALSYDKWVDGSYWARHGIAPPTQSTWSLGESFKSSSKWSPAEKAGGTQRGACAPWVTVREVFKDLPPYTAGYAGLWVEPHQLVRTAKFRGTEDVAMNPDLPSDTVTCRRGGAKTNDALIWDEDGKLRYLTIPEVAAIQAFPVDHPWQGSKSAKYKQVGNAVPPPLAEVLGRAIGERLR